MIRFTSTGLELSREVCKALLAFSSKDASRPNISCIGFNTGDVCAADGHAGVRFQKSERLPSDVQMGVFPRVYAELEYKLATARKGDVELLWEHLDSEQTFPPFAAVESGTRRIKVVPYRPVGFDAELFARMALVQKACTRPKADFEPSRLVDCTGHQQPFTFEVGSHSTGHPSLHYARVTIMPCSLA